jgi:beta-glucanase (GH16 family)
MKKSIFLAIGLLYAGILCGQDYELVWSDEFDADTINTDNWNFEIGNGSAGWGNNEKQYYTKRTENARCENGTLIITARKEDYNGYEYTSARMQTRSKAFWKYGRIEMRAKLPTGRGTWPAFWMMPQARNYGTNLWPDNGEIDIMEYVGYAPSKIYGTVHTNKNYGSSSIGKNMTYSGVENDFHVYAIEWTDTDIKWYVDSYYYGIYQRLERNWQYYPFDQNFYTILNFAVGGNWGGSQGIDTTIFPQTYEIDYVRVYQKNSTDVNENTNADKVILAPNPVDDKLRVYVPTNAGQSKISVFDSGGRMVIPASRYVEPYTEIDFSRLKAGIYMVLLQGKDQSKNYKVVKL